MPEVNRTWNTLRFSTGQGFNKPKHCVIKNSAGVLRMTNEYNGSLTAEQHEQPTLMFTFDCERLYTNLPLGDLKAKFDAFFETIFAFHAQSGQTYVAISSKGTAVWRTGHMPPHRMFRQCGIKQYCLDLQAAKQLFHLLIDNAYVQVGNRIFWQRQGIPMGINPAVYMTNFYVSTFEERFVRDLLQILL